MGVSDTGLRLAMLDTTRAGDERRLAIELAELSAAIDRRDAAERIVTDRLRHVLLIEQRIAEATAAMNQLINGRKA